MSDKVIRPPKKKKAKTLLSASIDSSTVVLEEPVNVSVVVNDAHCSQFMDRMTVSVCYSCNNCGHTGRHLKTVATHVEQCRSQPTPGTDAAFDKLLASWNYVTSMRDRRQGDIYFNLSNLLNTPKPAAGSDIHATATTGGPNPIPVTAVSTLPSMPETSVAATATKPPPPQESIDSDSESSTAATEQPDADDDTGMGLDSSDDDNEGNASPLGARAKPAPELSKCVLDLRSTRLHSNSFSPRSCRLIESSYIVF